VPFTRGGGKAHAMSHRRPIHFKGEKCELITSRREKKLGGRCGKAVSRKKKHKAANLFYRYLGAFTPICQEGGGKKEKKKHSGEGREERVLHCRHLLQRKKRTFDNKGERGKEKGEKNPPAWDEKRRGVKNEGDK